MERVCSVCSATFTPPLVGRDQRWFSVRETCSKECNAALISRLRRSAAAWSAPELEKLEELVGDFPVSLIHPQYSAWAAENGYPPRTAPAIRIRAQKLSPSIVSVGEWLQVGDVARLAGATRYQVARWIHQGYVHSSRHPDRKGGFRYVSRASLRKMAKARPHAFDRGDRDGLWTLLEDHALVDWLLTTRAERLAGKRPNYGIRKPVVMLATGRRYPSINHAAAVHGTNRWGVIRSIRSNGRLLLAGSAWAYAS